MNDASKRLQALLREVASQPGGEARLRPLYDRHGIEPSEGTDALVEEIQLDGANTFASLFRGWAGVDYDEIVRDVATKVGATLHSDYDESDAERAVLDVILDRYLKGSSEAERERIVEALQEAGADVTDLGRAVRNGAWTAGGIGMMATGAGEKAVAEAVKRIVMITVGRRAAGEAARRAAAFASYAIPILNVVMVGWTIVDLAGPALRKTVPTVIDVAILRMEFGREGTSEGHA